MRIAAITGLAAEARIARRAGIPAIATGGHPHRIAEAADELVRDGAEGLLSFGIAGALAPELVPGALLLPRRIIDEAGAAIAVDAAWHARMLDRFAAAGTRAEQGDLLGATRIIAAAEAKAALHQSTGAIAVDLESHRIAQQAGRLGAVFLTLRAIADPATCSLPRAATIALTESGRPRFAPVVLSLMRSPGQIPAILGVARMTQFALSMLRSASATLVRA